VFFIGVFATLIGFIAHKIPTLSLHGKTIKIFGLIVFVIGVYLEGALSMESHWREKISKLEEKVRVAEENAKKINTEIEYVYVDRVKEVKKIEYIVKEKIRESQNELDVNCVVSPKVSEILNSSARNGVGEMKK
jgi:hypothetical protein